MIVEVPAVKVASAPIDNGVEVLWLPYKTRLPAPRPNAPPASVLEELSPKAKVEVPAMRISIPAIKVDAKIQEVGITAKGNMAAPRTFSEVGWYKYGPRPGETGSAVLAGHVDNGIAFPAVFSKLDKRSKMRK